MSAPAPPRPRTARRPAPPDPAGGTNRSIAARSLPPPAVDATATATAIRIMGVLRIDEVAVRHTKPLEFVTALALAGGRMTRNALARRIYLSTSSDSAVPTLCYRARKLGIGIRFDPSSRVYSLTTPVVVDALRILDLLRVGDIASALDLWHGDCLPTSDTPLANALRRNLERAMVDAVLACDGPDLLRRAARALDSLELAEAASRAGGDPLTAILSDSFVAGTLQ